MDVLQNTMLGTGIFALTIIVFDVFIIILEIATCFAIIKMKDALNDIADVYCKINKAKFQEIKKQEEIASSIQPK